jgi:peptide/nickel transport system permease protein
VFLATEVLPGDPATTALGRFATPEAVEDLRGRLGLDRPLLVRYADWVVGLLRGDLGDSVVGLAQGRSSAPIGPLVAGRAANSAILATVTTILLIPLSLLLGAAAALRGGRTLDHLISTTMLVVVALPEFVVGSLLILLFFVQLGWLPPVSLVAPGDSPLGNPRILVLPVLTLLATSLAWTVRLVRSGMLDVLGKDFVQMARLHGLSGWTVVTRYALRNALAPSVQIFAVVIQYLVGGIIVTEAVFGYPGLGTALVEAVDTRDTRMVQSLAMVLSAVYVFIHLAADMLVMLLVPKLRTGE